MRTFKRIRFDFYVQVLSYLRPHLSLDEMQKLAANAAAIGLCRDPSNVDRCNKEEYEIPITTVLTVPYTKNALCVEVSVMKSAYAYNPYPTSRPSTDFNLGSQALHGNPDEEHYWQAVRDRTMAGVAEGLPGRRPTKVFLLGDNTYEDKFRAVREDALKSILGYVPGATIKTPFSALRKAWWL